MSGLRRELGLVEATAIVIGSMIGSGIFFVPNLVAREFPNSASILGLWFAGGLLAMAGALTVAELAAMFPRAGGPYDFVREAFGEHAGMLAGWAYFLLAKAALGAAVAVVFAVHLGQFFDLGPTQVRLVAVWLLAATTFANWLGVKLAGQIVNVLTALKIGALVALVLAVLIIPAGPSSSSSMLATTGAGRFTVAFLPILFAYNAWINATFLAEEVRDPERNLPRALALGVGTVMVLYIAANAAYLWVLGPDGVAASEVVAADTAGALVAAGAALLAATIMVSTAGNVHGGLLTGARLPMAMARDGWLPSSLGRLSRYATPGVALWVQFALASLAVLTGTFQEIVSYAIFITWGILLLVVIGLFRLRRTRPEAERPYRVPWYPVTPAVFALAAGFVLVNTVIEQPREALLGLAVVASGVPVLLVMRRR